MSLDVDLMVTQPVSVFTQNITHNLGKMAEEVKLQNGMTLYDVLWRPDEQEGLVFAKDIVDLLDEAHSILLKDRERLVQYNPENGWGNYEGLVRFVVNYHEGCKENPDAEIRVCR